MSRSARITLCAILAMLATAAALALLLAVLSHLAFYTRAGHVEHVRRNADVPAFAPELARVNAQILQMREYNRRWWLDWAIPDGWDDVPIVIRSDDFAQRQQAGRGEETP